MLQRTPEPDLMNGAEQTLAYAQADFSEPHNAFVAHFLRLFPTFACGHVLDLGCGPADIGIRLCKALPAVALTGVDGAAAMLELGRETIERQGLTQRITLEQRYLPDATLPRSAYDAAISNSLLHHLNDPGALWQTLRHGTRAGAPVLVMDLMRPATLVEAERLKQRYAADAPPVLQQDFFNSLLASYRPDEIRDQLAVAGLNRWQVKAVSDRHFIVWGNA